jgi:hypothetical protein
LILIGFSALLDYEDLLDSKDVGEREEELFKKFASMENLLDIKQSEVAKFTLQMFDQLNMDKKNLR